MPLEILMMYQVKIKKKYKLLINILGDLQNRSDLSFYELEYKRRSLFVF